LKIASGASDCRVFSKLLRVSLYCEKRRALTFGSELDVELSVDCVEVWRDEQEYGEELDGG
jgi:hypothetical protein